MTKIESRERQPPLATDKKGPLVLLSRPKRSSGSRYGVPSNLNPCLLPTTNPRIRPLILIILRHHHHRHHHHLIQAKMKFKILIAKWKTKKYVYGYLTKRFVQVDQSKTVSINQLKSVRKNVRISGSAMSVTTWNKKRLLLDLQLHPRAPSLLDLRSDLPIDHRVHLHHPQVPS